MHSPGREPGVWIPMISSPEGATVRGFDYVRRADAIIVFHAFQKKSQKTPSREIHLARERLQEVSDEAIES